MRRTGWQGSAKNIALGHKARYKHGSTQTYKIWQHVRQRCENPNDSRYKDYGGRGIRVCERWQVFANFLADMGERPEGKSLDRYPDKNGDYEPGNCRWATRSEQQNNTRSNRLIIWNGETLTLAEASRRLGLERGVLQARLNRGWSIERAINEPAKRKVAATAQPETGKEQRRAG